MSKLGEDIGKALAETEKLQKTIEGMKDGPSKEEEKRRAQKLKGDLVKALAKEPNIHEC